jgi:hypothetical protein
MSRLEHLQGKTDFFIFDLEFIGQIGNLHSCRIWEISVFATATGNWFTKVVDPDPTLKVFAKPPIPELPQLTRTFLKAQKAQTWKIVLIELIQWVSCQTDKIPVFVSHNTFKADKPIMELESKRHQLLLPLHWFFFDSLHFCRENVTSPSGNFSLGGLHQHFFQQPICNAHRAKYDVIACHRILNAITNGRWVLTGPIYSSYTNSLRSIKWVGKKAELVFAACHVHSVETLLFILKTNAFKDYITQQLNSQQSIQKTIVAMLHSKLPPDNIQNIVKVMTQCFSPQLLGPVG